MGIELMQSAAKRAASFGAMHPYNGPDADAKLAAVDADAPGGNPGLSLAARADAEFRQHARQTMARL